MRKGLELSAGHGSDRTSVKRKEKKSRVHTQKWWRKKKNTIGVAREGKTRGEEGTMCVHAAHVACQPAWQPVVDSLRPLPPLASKSEVPFLSFFPPSPSPPSSLSVSRSISRSLSLSLPRSVRSFFPLFLRKSSAERKGIFLFIKLQPLTWSAPTHGPTCGWMGAATGERLPRTLAARNLKAVSRDRIFRARFRGTG